MIRRAFTMRLKPGARAEYIRHHDSVPTRWTALVAEIERSGIARITTFAEDGDAPRLFLYSEIHDEAAWAKLWDSAIHREWGAFMEPLMRFRDGKVDASGLTEIFHLETAAGAGRAAKA
ncbi:MAG TPA: L-rhamnose mutarotase [Planctomycetota bacterium]|nr:L-rhamnose mutarotase [Planctomycetota bacterium]